MAQGHPHARWSASKRDGHRSESVHRLPDGGDVHPRVRLAQLQSAGLLCGGWQRRRNFRLVREQMACAPVARQDGQVELQGVVYQGQKRGGGRCGTRTPVAGCDGVSGASTSRPPTRRARLPREGPADYTWAGITCNSPARRSISSRRARTPRRTSSPTAISTAISRRTATRTTS